MSRRIEIIDTIDEWMVGAERHRIVQWSDKTYSLQRIYVEQGVPRWVSEPLSRLDVWDRYPELAPPFVREQAWHMRQEARRRNVWWRRILREAGWR